MNYEENVEIMRYNIYKCLIDHNEMRKIAVQTFQCIDNNQQGFISEEQIQLFIKIFLKKINARDLLSSKQISTIFKECLIEK